MFIHTWDICMPVWTSMCLSLPSNICTYVCPYVYPYIHQICKYVWIFYLCLHLWQLYLVFQPQLWLLQWISPLRGWQELWVSMLWLCYHQWSQGTQKGVLLALHLCHSSNPSPRCILRFLPIVPWSSAGDFFWVDPPTNFLI